MKSLSDSLFKDLDGEKVKVLSFSLASPLSVTQRPSFYLISNLTVMRNTESVKIPCEKCGHLPIGMNAEKFRAAMLLSPAQVELAEKMCPEHSGDYLRAIDTWLLSAFDLRSCADPVDEVEWQDMGWIYRLQILIRDIVTEHACESSLDEAGLREESLPDDVWEVINTVEHMFEELDAKKGKVTPGTYKHLMKATSVVISKYRA